MRILQSAVIMFLAAVAPLHSRGALPYEILEDKAQRFVASSEWASAEAMYQLMAEERPNQPEAYAGGIVAAGMRRQPAIQNRFMNAAIKSRVPFAPLFKAVRSESFRLGNTTLYEQFLLLTAREHSWMARSIDGYLLDYYTYRRNPDAMIAYSRRMLDGMPDNTSYALTLAQGYLLAGDVENAIKTYQHIVDNNPDNYDALLYLGMYYSSKNSGESGVKAKDYLERAYAVKPTPYVESMLKTLSVTHK